MEAVVLKIPSVPVSRMSGSGVGPNEREWPADATQKKPQPTGCIDCVSLRVVVLVCDPLGKRAQENKQSGQNDEHYRHHCPCEVGKAVNHRSADQVSRVKSLMRWWAVD